MVDDLILICLYLRFVKLFVYGKTLIILTLFPWWLHVLQETIVGYICFTILHKKYDILWKTSQQNFFTYKKAIETFRKNEKETDNIYMVEKFLRNLYAK